MNQPQGLAPIPQLEGLDPKYPAPPRIHWFTLLLAWTIVSAAIAEYAPKAYQGIFQSLVVDAWAFYLCNWIRTLDSDAKSPFWCDVYVVVELGCAVLASIHSRSATASFLAFTLAMVSAVLGIATIFLVRADLQNHYNNQEHTGLVLSAEMTFFFSFLYFQYHLYRIAKRRKQVVAGLSAGQVS